MSRRKVTQQPDQHSTNWLEQLDKRTGLAQEINRRYVELTNDLGGESQLSYQQRALVSRLLFIELSLQKQEAELSRGGELDSGSYTQQINTLLGLVKSLGLQRQTKDVPDLSDFLKRRASQ